jgi:hypothetical protein
MKNIAGNILSMLISLFATINAFSQGNLIGIILGAAASAWNIRMMFTLHNIRGINMKFARINKGGIPMMPHWIMVGTRSTPMRRGATDAKNQSQYTPQGKSAPQEGSQTLLVGSQR